MLFHQFIYFHRLVKLYKIMKLLSRGFSLNRWFLPIGENPISVENTYSTLVVMVFKCLLVFFQIILKGLKSYD